MVNDDQNHFEKFFKCPLIDFVEDSIEDRFPHLVKLLYLSYRLGFRNIRNSILDDLAEAADLGRFDDWE